MVPESQIRTEFGFERTTCACDNCKLNCQFMPGFLIPSDLDRMIPPQMQPLPWAELTLLASPGALVAKGSDLFRIPTLVPAVKNNGSCINLHEGQCLIHPIAPFGCAFFDCGPERGNLSHHGLNAVYAAWLEPASLYRRIWMHLFDKNLVQQKAETLRMRMHVELEVKRLRAEGWTREDFVEALKKVL